MKTIVKWFNKFESERTKDAIIIALGIFALAFILLGIAAFKHNMLN